MCQMQVIFRIMVTVCNSLGKVSMHKFKNNKREITSKNLSVQMAHLSVKILS